MRRNPFYWYAGKLKKTGGIMIFSSHRRYSRKQALGFSPRFTWLSMPKKTMKEATEVVKSQTSLKNPPTMTVVHKGQITVQHLADPKAIQARTAKRRTRKNPRNHLGEKEYYTYAGWKQAIKKKHPTATFTGSREIGAASVQRNGKPWDVGEWDGMTGTLFIDGNRSNPSYSREDTYRKWKQECKLRYPDGILEGSVRHADCYDAEGHRVGVWNGTEGRVSGSKTNPPDGYIEENPSSFRSSIDYEREKIEKKCRRLQQGYLRALQQGNRVVANRLLSQISECLASRRTLGNPSRAWHSRELGVLQRLKAIVAEDPTLASGTREKLLCELDGAIGAEQKSLEEENIHL